jgi:hypothetical protein
MDPTNFRLRHLAGVFLAAVVTAAVLRHVVHVYGGWSRQEIRTAALIAIGVAILLVIVGIRWSKRQS